ncbi:protein Diedel-like [Drosophila biarmipes]|uniref:protein Diedel-like n=1 Tax=Drosophila biarmipes TaxID=125945 RepID=UPI0007E5D43C|nr:protein Diedel-like [Drosophila biarmipes]
MASPLVSLLLIGICCLGLVHQSSAVCCATKEEVTFKIARGTCKDVGGYAIGRDACQLLICADGLAQVGMFCGQGSCNVFGCNCDGGCLEGDWSRTFAERYEIYGVEVINVNRMAPYGG